MSGKTILVPLTRNKFAIVDELDAWVLQHKWYAGKCGKSNNLWYAARRIYGLDGKSRNVLLHREILYALPGEVIDHRDCDSLNNRRANLRFCPRGQSDNIANQRRSSNNASGFKGVGWDKRRKKWRARICPNGRDIYLGSFTDPIEAARVYDKAAVRLFGEFALLNFQQEQSNAA